MTGIDYSFLRLKTDFALAKLDKMVDSEYYYKGGICLHPLERYLQISYSDVDVAFAEDYKVEIIDCSENVLLDISDKVYIAERQDNDGIYRISFEILPIDQDFYYQKIYLKFTHTASTLVLYSNEFLLTAGELANTFRLDYKSYSNYKGTNYPLADYYQSIRLFGYFNAINEKKDSKVYTELNGQLRKSRVIQSFESEYVIDEINTFVYERLAVALENDLVYLNGSKCEVIDTLGAEERKGKSNLIGASFKAQINESEIYLDSNQIAPIFNYTSLSPLGIYTLSGLPTDANASFNYDLTSVVYLKLYDYETDAFINSLMVSIIDNEFTATLPTLTNGKYYFTFKVINIFNETLEVTDKDIWSFEVKDGVYDSTIYNNSQYLTV